MVLRSGQKWSELGLRAERPLDVVDAIRRVNALRMPGRPPHLKPRLTPSHNSGNIILRAQNLRVGYPEHALFSVPGLELIRGECAALIGPNGSGKTTFLKTLLGQLDPLEGRVHLGASLKVGYFAQAHEALRLDGTVLDELLRHKGMSDSQARNYLAQYLFRGDDVFKTVSSLSGGERARLALAVLALADPNFLLLDEPTNHLDIPAQEALQEVLGNFTGTILLVSHDRYLIDRLATQIWELRGGRLEVFRGTYREFVLHNTASAAQPRQILLAPKPLARDNGKETRQRQQALAQVEARIRDQELTVQRLARELQQLGDKKAFAQTRALSWEYAKAQTRLEQLTSEWEKLAV
jgi:ATP-binding cassette, subfamily F, member 3